MKNRKRLVHKPDATRKLFLIPLLLLLIVGTVISVIQIKNTQQTQSLAGVPKDCTVDPTKLTYSPAEQMLFDKINAFRQANNVPPLVSNLTLKQAAAWMSKDLQARHILVHIDSFGRDTSTRLADCGLPFPSVVGEIIDSGNADADSLMGAWSHSPSQTTRLLNKNFTHVGIALATGSSYNNTETYWTVTFSGPDIKPTAPNYNPYYPYPSFGMTPPGGGQPGNPTPTRPQGGAPTPTPVNSKKPTPTPTRKPTPTPTPKFGQVPTPTPTPNFGGAPTPTPLSRVFPFGTPTPSPIPFPGKNPTPGPGGPGKNCNNPPLRTIDPKFVKNENDIQLFLSVKFPGIGCDGNKNPVHQSRRIQASIIDTENKEIKVGTADLIYDGNFFRGTMHLGKIPNDIYSIKLAGVRTLQRVIEPQFQQIASQKLNIMPELIIRTGDVSEDNALTLLDYSMSLSCFQDKKCKADAIEFVDFNDSGTADVIDYNLLLQAFYQLSGD